MNDQDCIRTVFITGSSSGIGLGIAHAAVSDPEFRVHGFSRSAGPQHPAYQHHNIDLAKTENLIDFNFPQVGNSAQLVLINNAGTLGEMDYMGSLDPKKIISGITLNLTAPLILMNQFINQFKNLNAEKVIINIGTGAAQNPYDGWGLYCSAKAGLEMASRVTALEQDISKNGFMVFSIAPGVVETGMQKKIRSTNPIQFSRKEKFQKLFDDKQLTDPDSVGQKFIDLIKDARDIREGVFRIG